MRSSLTLARETLSPRGRGWPSGEAARRVRGRATGSELAGRPLTRPLAALASTLSREGPARGEGFRARRTAEDHQLRSVSRPRHGSPYIGRRDQTDPRRRTDRIGRAPRRGDRDQPAARALRPLVRGARLGAAGASARPAGEGACRPLGAADRTDRRRQDPGGLPAHAGRAERTSPPDRSSAGPLPDAGEGRPAPRHWPAHPLHLAAEGARGRHRAQSRAAGRRDGPAGDDRDPHRRHAGLAPHAPAPPPARHPAHHAGAGRAAAVDRRRAASVRDPAPGRARRIALARHLQARRPACRSTSPACSRSRRG